MTARAQPPRCPTCGQVVLAKGMTLTRTQSRILGIIKRRGTATSEELCDALWASTVNGANNASTLHVHVWHLNQRLKPHGVAVRASRWAGYRLVDLKDPP